MTVKAVLYDNRTGAIIQSADRTVKKGKTFRITFRIPAKLAEYDLAIFAGFHDNNYKKVKLVRNLVAGDFFIVSGQSNAECGFDGNSRAHDSMYFIPSNRALGGNISWATQMMSDSTEQLPILQDCHFAPPHSYYTAHYYNSYSGLWPMKLQYELAKATGIPNCVVNGSRGGSPLHEHYASHTPSIPDSLIFKPDFRKQKAYLLYDRIYKKLYQTGAADGVKAIFWYQGETDGYAERDSAINYYKRFGRLYRSWVSDYPSLEKVFVVQLNMGCGDLHHSIIREMQRRLPIDYPKVVVIPSFGTSRADRRDDLCHYTINGYDKIADKLFPSAHKLLYGSTMNEDEVMPPDILNIFYSEKDQICLEFNKEVAIEDSMWYEGEQNYIKLKNYFFDQDQIRINVNRISSDKTKIYLDLNDSNQTITSLTYLPKAFTETPSLYCGPFLRNAKNTSLTALSFYDFPVHVIPPDRDMNQNATFFIAPNPVREYLKISSTGEKSYKYALVNIFGNIVSEGVAMTGTTLIPVEGLPRGLYILQLQDGKNTHAKKIIIH